MEDTKPNRHLTLVRLAQKYSASSEYNRMALKARRLRAEIECELLTELENIVLSNHAARNIDALSGNRLTSADVPSKFLEIADKARVNQVESIPVKGEKLYSMHDLVDHVLKTEHPDVWGFEQFMLSNQKKRSASHKKEMMASE